MTHKNRTQIVVIGGGHAGVEAAMASARMGISTTLVSLRRDGIGQMSCNPAIGGLGKGHLVKEVDALGGVMGRAIDDTGVQFRTLNSSKGPAVRASRAQADRDLYKARVLSLCEAEPNLKIIQGEAARILTEGRRVTGVGLGDGSEVLGDAVVLTTGTFLRGLMHTGPAQTEGGRHGDKASNSLSDSLSSLGFTLGRLKTGTPPRLRRSSINFSVLSEQPGETPIRPFSMMTARIDRPQLSCWITNTTEAAHELIRANREQSPMFNGQIQSRGPRYCPSIEDKVYRFADKSSHNIFLEPEGFESDIVYPNGISTSLPLDVQERFVRLIPGLESVEILRAGYAVEYDMVDPRALTPALETKEIEGLFLAGQINGTSGYEEAAAQGVVAGINAALKVQGKPPFIIDRGEGYIGVMIDDLITHGVDEPYRMFTSRAEYRLHLREDNAWLRLCKRGIDVGVVGEQQRETFEKKVAQFERAKGFLTTQRVKPDSATNEWLAGLESATLKDGITLAALLKRPEFTLKAIAERFPVDELEVETDLAEQIETELKFAGYLTRQDEEIAKLRQSESTTIPGDFAYGSVKGLSIEVREKLLKVRPYSLGQAMRIPGVTPAAISLLAVYLKRAPVDACSVSEKSCA